MITQAELEQLRADLAMARAHAAVSAQSAGAWREIALENAREVGRLTYLLEEARKKPQ